MAVKYACIFIDDFTYRAEDFPNVTVYDYASYDTYQVNDYFYYDYWGYEYGRGIPDDNTYSYSSNYGWYDINEYDNPAIYSDTFTLGPFWDYDTSSYYYSDSFTYTTLNPVSPSDNSTPKHGDWVLNAFFDQLDDPTSVEVICIDADDLDWYDLFDKNSQDVYVFENIVASALNDLSEDNTKHIIAGLSASFTTGLDSYFLDPINRLLDYGFFVTQSASNVGKVWPVWGEALSDVINVGAWNIDSNAYSLAAHTPNLEYIDIYADGLTFHSNWDNGYNFGTSFATPSVFAEIVNLFHDSYNDLIEDGTIIPESGEVDRNEYKLIVDEVIDSISTDVEVTYAYEGEKYSSTIPVMTDDLIENNAQPITTPFSLNESGISFVSSSIPINYVDASSGGLFRGSYFSDEISGNSSAIEVFAGDWDDVIIDSSESDYINGEEGDDDIKSYAGADWILGGGGSDEIFLDGDKTWDDDSIAVNTSLFSISECYEALFSIAGMTKLEQVVHGGDGSDSIILTNRSDLIALDDSISGFYQSETTLDERFNDIEFIDAGDGDDLIDLTSETYIYDYGITIDGGNGNDTLWGSSYNDIIKGGSGSDIIFGGSGNDELFGGEGSDIFEFAYGSGNDVINDFDISSDKLFFYSVANWKDGIFHGDLSDMTINNGKINWNDELTVDLGNSDIVDFSMIDIEIEYI